MGANKKYNKMYGFTIVEVLIVLAVTGALFVSVALILSGQIARNQERQAAGAIEVYARDILNDVATGYYPENGTFYRCAASGGPAPNITTGTATDERGTSQNCVFAGKRITFTNTAIEVDSVAALANLSSITNLNQLAVVQANGNSLKETIPYPYQYTRTGLNKTYYVLNRLLSPSSAQEANFVAGGQSVTIVDSSNNSPASANGFTLCFPANNGFIRLNLAANGGSNVTVEQGVATCNES